MQSRPLQRRCARPASRPATKPVPALTVGALIPPSVVRSLPWSLACSVPSCLGSIP